MTKVQIVSSRNSAPNLFCSKKNYKNKKNPVFIVFYKKLLATIIYVNKNIAKAQSRFRGQGEVNQPCYYTSVSMITGREVQKLV